MKKYHLLAPGPTPIPPEVLQAIAQPILHHRTPEFEALFGRVRAGLAELVGTRNEVMILAASGTGALEAAVVNLCSPGDEVLVIEALKMEHLVYAPCSGKVAEIRVSKGDAVEDDTVLMIIAEA